MVFLRKYMNFKESIVFYRNYIDFGAFDGFTITQISDIHSGSFDNAAKVNYGIDLINKQQSDVILFTGDIVNNKASRFYH